MMHPINVESLPTATVAPKTWDPKRGNKIVWTETTRELANNVSRMEKSRHGGIAASNMSKGPRQEPGLIPGTKRKAEGSRSEKATREARDNEGGPEETMIIRMPPIGSNY